MDNEAIKQEINDALSNIPLQNALTRLLLLIQGNRAKALLAMILKPCVTFHEVKSYAADHIDEILEQFKKNVVARGGKVFHAKNGKDAAEYIRKLATDKGVKSVVKSKSMATEEIHLNEVLREEGIDVQETDLGEFINAISGDTPVHMIYAGYPSF